MITVDSLGSRAFKEQHGIRYAYVQGSMVRGIASVPMVINMAKAGFLGYFGTGALRLPAIETALQEIQAALPNGEPYGMNLLSGGAVSQLERDTVDLLLKYNVRRVEASAYMQISPPLVKYRAKGLRRNGAGHPVIENLIMAKLSRPEVAMAFLSPAPERMVAEMVQTGELSTDEADLVRHVPMADDICVEADSGGHTDMGVLSTLLPAIVRLRDQMAEQYETPTQIRVGGAGGIGTPEAAATAFVLGADFILTGSINQCTVEAGTSDVAKDLLQNINVQDTDYAPSGSMFELGAKTQVLKKGVFFPARANKLYDLWRANAGLHEIDQKTLTQIQDKYFKRGFDDVYDETKKYYLKAAPAEIEKAEKNARHKMALIFRWYFVHTMRLAVTGAQDQKVDYQIHCGPSMGAFNQWVKGSSQEDWRNRRTADIGHRIMEETADLLNRRFGALSA